jgi:ABC-type multidrug transport system ATPase subunit
MKQKLALCCALVHRPDVLFLDEPTTGVDAVSRREFWDLLGQLTRGGLTTVVSTPYMDEADRCDRVALIQRGKLLAVDTPEAIAKSFDRPLLGIRTSRHYQVLQAVREYAHAHSVYPFGESLHYTDARPQVPVDQIARELQAFLESKGVRDARIAPIAATVEDTFMARMGAAGAEGPLRQ